MEKSGVGQAVVVLSVSHLENSHNRLRGIFGRTKWRLEESHGSQKALARLRNDPVSVVLYEDDVPDGSWREFLQAVEELPNPPLVIVTSRNADERLWAEVLNRGGYDLLSSEVTRVISLAWFHKHRQRKSDFRSEAMA